MKDVIKIAIVDDHALLRKGISWLLKNENADIVVEADNGEDLITKLKALEKNRFPDVFLIDINMPFMDGFQLTEWLNNNHPGSKIIISTMYDSKQAIMKAVKLGVKSFITKDKPVEELIKAIESAYNDKLYFPEEVLNIIVESHQTDTAVGTIVEGFPNLNDREKSIMKLFGTELTYAEIARELNLSTRTIDGYRDSLFQKFDVKTRVGLVLKAVEMKIIPINVK
jgi:two-component system invasion response regulator UvrY